VKWYPSGVLDGKIGPTFVLFSGEACFLLSEYVKFQNNGYWCVEHSLLIHAVSLNDKVSV
jgi:hypothetical protein